MNLAQDIVKVWEGCKLTAYKCPAGVWTIGYGATGDGITRGTTWTQGKAEADLHSRLSALGARIDALVLVTLTAGQMAALVSFAYNVGIEAFRKSSMLRLLNAGNYAEAGAQFARWNRADGKVLQGLVNRRADEARLFGGK